MKIGITGLPSSGKSTVFNVLTGAHIEIKSYTSGKSECHLGMIKVPDERVEQLARIFHPKKSTHTEIGFVDSARLEREHPERFLDVPHIKDVEALVHVVRLFKDERVPHPKGSIDAARDVATVELELMLLDLETIQHRLDSLKKEVASGKKEAVKEHQLLQECQKSLENEVPLRSVEFTPEEEKAVKGFQFLSMKPMMIVANIDESMMKEALPPALCKFAEGKKIGLLSFCAKVEMEIEELPEEERAEFLKVEGITEPAREKFIRQCYQMLDLVTFFTGNENEVKAWTIKKGTTAWGAAGKIHSDMQRGFIKAEVINFKALKECGSMRAAKEKGLLKLEGKEYIVQDGDVINFRFSV